GLPKEKLVLGVPFYGYGFGSYKSDYTYASILTEFGFDAANHDLIGTACAGCDYITYNGAATINAKTRLGIEEGAGVMIWELSQDVAGANSLLKVIDDEIKQLTGSSSSASTSANAQSSTNSVTSSVAAADGKSSGGGSFGIA